MRFYNVVGLAFNAEGVACQWTVCAYLDDEGELADRHCNVIREWVMPRVRDAARWEVGCPHDPRLLEIVKLTPKLLGLTYFVDTIGEAPGYACTGCTGLATDPACALHGGDPHALARENARCDRLRLMRDVIADSQTRVRDVDATELARRLEAMQLGRSVTRAILIDSESADVACTCVLRRASPAPGDVRARRVLEADARCPIHGACASVGHRWIYNVPDNRRLCDRCGVPQPETQQQIAPPDPRDDADPPATNEEIACLVVGHNWIRWEGDSSPADDYDRHGTCRRCGTSEGFPG